MVVIISFFSMRKVFANKKLYIRVVCANKECVFDTIAEILPTFGEKINKETRKLVKCYLIST